MSIEHDIQAVLNVCSRSASIKEDFVWPASSIYSKAHLHIPKIFWALSIHSQDLDTVHIQALGTALAHHVACSTLEQNRCRPSAPHLGTHKKAASPLRTFFILSVFPSCPRQFLPSNRLRTPLSDILENCTTSL